MAKKFFQRWYEKDEYLKAFMNLMQDLAPEVQCEIAIDIIMKASNMIDRDYTKLIAEVSIYNPRDFKRWYDKNPNVHLAIEALRDLNSEQRDEIVREFSAEILNSHFIKLDDVGDMP
ncbi:MAG: hypothetical protein IKU37_06685 [Candidatus Gastranaerophilales bacterium]|nr:hypothetical protein [Candidatus Gastranaerophilales bacterium]